MATITDDPNHPDLRVADTNGQDKAYLVLPESERSKGFARPYRDSYVHEVCKVETIMSRALAETYARDPKFYGKTFCCGCGKHLPVSEFTWLDGERVGS